MSLLLLFPADKKRAWRDNTAPCSFVFLLNLNNLRRLLLLRVVEAVERLRAFVLEAAFGEFFVEFAREGECGEVELHRVGGLLGELHVLDVVLDEEAGLEVALEDARSLVG